MASKVNIEQVAEQLAALTAVVGNMVRAQYSAPTPAAAPAVSQTPAPAPASPVVVAPVIPPAATATKARKSTRKASPPAQTSAAPAHPVKDKSFTIQLVKFGSTLNSVKYRELVNGQPLAVETTGYAGGFVGDMHIRAEALAAAGVLKRSGKKADGPDTISITVVLSPSANAIK